LADGGGAGAAQSVRRSTPLGRRRRNGRRPCPLAHGSPVIERLSFNTAGAVRSFIGACAARWAPPPLKETPCEPLSPWSCSASPRYCSPRATRTPVARRHRPSSRRTPALHHRFRPTHPCHRRPRLHPQPPTACPHRCERRVEPPAHGPPAGRACPCPWRVRTTITPHRSRRQGLPARPARREVRVPAPARVQVMPARWHGSWRLARVRSCR